MTTEYELYDLISDREGIMLLRRVLTRLQEQLITTSNSDWKPVYTAYCLVLSIVEGRVLRD